MGDHRDGTPHKSGAVVTSDGAEQDQFPNPGLPPHRPRVTDVDPKAAKRAEHQVVLLFLLSMVGSVLFFVAYFGIRVDGPLYDAVNTEPTSQLRLQNTLLGLGIALGMFGIGIGVGHWAKTLMPDHETATRSSVRPC